MIFQRRGASCFRRILFWGWFFSWEIILFQKNPLPGMLFHSRNHPVSKDCSSGDYFSVKKSSCFREMLSQGWFSSEEIILFRKNALLGITFQCRNHPDSEKCSPRDDFPQKNASWFRGILSQGCFSTEESILIQKNPLSGMLFHSRNHPDSEECSPKDYFPQKKSSWFRGILSQGCFSTAEIILIQRISLPGMLFHSRNHPDSEKSSLRDAFPQQKSSWFKGIFSQGWFHDKRVIS